MSVSEGEQLPPAKYPSHSVACFLASLLVSQPFFSVNLHASRCMQHVCPHAPRFYPVHPAHAGNTTPLAYACIALCQ